MARSAPSRPAPAANNAVEDARAGIASASQAPVAAETAAADAAPIETAPVETAPVETAMVDPVAVEPAAAAPEQRAEPERPAAVRERPIAAAPAPDPYADYAIDRDGVQERRPRRNPARYWTIGAILFAVVAAAAGGALWHFGPPGWAVNLGLAINREQPQLLFYLPKEPERRKLPTGEEYFAFSGRIVNSADQELTVPPIVVELRDAQGRLVFSWITKADKALLKPNEEARVSESRLDIPKNARNLSLKFVDDSGT